MHPPGRWSATWPTRRSRALDVFLALGLAGLDGVLLWVQVEDYWFPAPFVSACSVLLGLALIVRRRHPARLALGAILFGSVTGAGAFAYVVILYSLAAYTPSRRVVFGLAGLGYASLLALPSPTPDDGGILGRAFTGIVFIACPLLLGLYMGARKQLLGSLQERTARLEREQHLLAERARAEERTRIAREMHDVVANRVSVMVVHAGALKAIAVRDPARAAETAAVIGDMGRQALDELRHVIGVLRQGEEALPQEAVTLAHIRELVDQSSAAGLRVDLTVRGDERPMAKAAGRTVYRLVQEALTNVHKHAGDADTCVDLGLFPDAVEVEITNGAPHAGPDHGLPSGGNGLVGLRERVTALGGTFAAGPTPDGGYTVGARIPLPTS